MVRHRTPIRGGLRGLTLLSVLQSRMALSPDAHHLAGNLARIAERAGVRSYNFMSALARVAVRVFALILADANDHYKALGFLE